MLAELPAGGGVGPPVCASARLPEAGDRWSPEAQRRFSGLFGALPACRGNTGDGGGGGAPRPPLPPGSTADRAGSPLACFCNRLPAAPTSRAPAAKVKVKVAQVTSSGPIRRLRVGGAKCSRVLGDGARSYSSQPIPELLLTSQDGESSCSSIFSP